ncbi:MAG: hypothetical protein ABGZ36_11670, partial [Actinomycetota bacterium]
NEFSTVRVPLGAFTTDRPEFDPSHLDILRLQVGEAHGSPLGRVGIDDIEILQPRKLYEAQGRSEEYAQLVARVKAERDEFMAKHEGLRPEIVKALG